MSGVHVTLLGYVCINPKNKEDFKVFTGLDELINKSGKNVCEVEPVDIETLPIVDKSLLTEKNLTFPLEQEVTNNGLIEYKFNPIETFRQRFPTLRLNQGFREKYSVPVSTSRKMLREFLNRLAFTNGMKVVNGNKNWDLLRYDQDFLVENDKLSESLIIRPDTERTRFEGFGLDVENYLTKRQGEGTCYQVFSIHVLAHPQSKTHFVYSAQVDGFLFDKTTRELSPVEIKCVKNHKRNMEPQYLQARLGQVKKMIFASYEDSNKGLKWNISHFEVKDVPRAASFPEYGNDRILLLCKFLEYNKNIPYRMTIEEKANGKILNVQFGGFNATTFWKGKVSLNCVLGKCEHTKSNPNTTVISMRKCKEHVDQWITLLGDGSLNTLTAFT
ncbi:unnamed protein product [Orchesella dallaii]|uniref:Decapping nuclease n=1 Tax=Orchesella dallaii TaxID=48710 RepID=A0ABP1R5M9_9HEXA